MYNIDIQELNRIAARLKGETEWYGTDVSVHAHGESLKYIPITPATKPCKRAGELFAIKKGATKGEIYGLLFRLLTTKIDGVAVQSSLKKWADSWQDAP